ncbi:bacteriohemerythrin [Pseudodesulfovibrio sp. F-1]|uniref:Bacteriohemerythrin n=1 Tax=Pseudodesulfovibrio alkaliphilus TaxID=2661613 RepID=A0A7K1KNK5_9BACT|nr:bacteriohemerythrin [Pseudodesulfovibrio alkaliphilus]MUM77669.1 bacteriohemerythrin [Pseudodesulfovibrio alkaliphilus]
MGTNQILWNEEDSVGVPSIDAQHKELVAITNRLFLSIVKDDASAAVLGILAELTRYAEQHFAHEEALLVEHGYPGDLLKPHIAEHESLTAQVHDFLRRASQDTDILDLEVYDFLRDWMTKHLQRTDRTYAEFLCARGAR